MTFDYVQAWEEHARPGFYALPESIREFCRLVAFKGKDLNQNESLRIDAPDWAVEAMKKLPAEALPKAAEIIYNYGHWYPGDVERELPQNGWYWKVQILLVDFLIANHPELREAIYKGKVQEERNTKRFMVSEAEFKRREVRREAWEPVYVPITAETVDRTSDEDLTMYVKQSCPSLHQLARINHRLKPGIFPRKNANPDGPFVIGSEHMERSYGGILDPRSAPCERTGCDYDDFTSDFVAVMLVSQEEPDEKERTELQAEAEKVAALLEEVGKPVDGFVFTLEKRHDTK